MHRLRRRRLDRRIAIPFHRAVPHVARAALAPNNPGDALEPGDLA
jgi:hypothetical protein